MDLHSNIGFYFALVSLMSGLIGWLMSSYFSAEKLKEKDSDLLNRNTQLNLLAQKVDKEKSEYEEKIFHLKDEIRILRGKNIDLRKNEGTVGMVESEIDYNAKAHMDKLSLGDLAIKDNGLSHEKFALIKDENSYLKDEVELLKVNIQAANSPKPIEKLKKELKKRKAKYKNLRKEYNLMIVEYNDLLTQYKKMRKKKSQPSKSATNTTVTKEVKIKEAIDFKKLKKVLLNKLPIITTRKVVNKPNSKSKS